MMDDELERLLRDAARTYNRPRDLDDADALWADIDRALDAPQALHADRPTLAVVRDDTPAPRPRRTWWASPYLRTAAALFVGVALGRVSTRLTAPAPAPAPTVAAVAVPNAETVPNDLPAADRSAANEYLGRAAVLLAALPDELRAGRTDAAYLSQADALLLQTRLMLDSPAAADPTLHSLFDDLEVVLAQVVRLHSDRDPTRVELLNEAIQQRDVLPRLRDAVADNAGD